MVTLAIQLPVIIIFRGQSQTLLKLVVSNLIKLLILLSKLLLVSKLLLSKVVLKMILNKY